MSADDQPIARRRTPRKSMPPSRLGVDDDWASQPASKWTPDRGLLKKQEAEKVKARTDRIKQEEEEETAATIGDPQGGYIALREKLPATTSFVEAACLALLGDAVAQRVILQKEELELPRLVMFTLWGAGVSLLVGPFQKYMRSLTLSSTAAVDTSAKALIGQLTVSPLLILLLIGYMQLFKICLELGAKAGVESFDVNKYKLEVQASFGERYAVAFTFWLLADLLNYAVVPTQYCMLYTSTLSSVWACISSAMSP